MSEITVETGYQPRNHQQEVHRKRKRFNVLVCHRRFGKTVLCINELIEGALTCERERPRFAYIAPLYKQAKTIAWDYLKEYTACIPGRKVNESELRVDLPNGGRITLYGADNPDALRGIYLDGVVMDEFAQMQPSLWGQVIRPLLADREGWAVFIGTPKGHNQFYDLYQRAQANEDWFAAMYRASETGVLPDGELQALRDELDEDEYEQELECSFSAAIKGAYFGRLMNQAEAEGRIGDVPHDPVLPVRTGWDIGVGDTNVIWFFQQQGTRIHVINCYANNGHGVDHYWRKLQEFRDTYGYSYAEERAHLGPHDLQSREYGSGRTPQEQASKLGLKFHIVPRVHKKDHGHDAIRAILPRCVFDAEKCRDGIEALRQYRHEFDEKLNTFKETRLHDWCSDYADAFQTLALGIKDQYVTPEPRFERTFNEALFEHLKAADSDRGTRI